MMPAGELLAQADAIPRGWWVGIAIGALVVVIVAAVVITLILLARRIAHQADMARAALDEAERNTRALWDVAEVNHKAMAVLEGAIRAREAVEDAT